MPAGRPQGAEQVLSLLAQPLRAAETLHFYQEARIRQFTTGGILLDTLTCLARCTFNINQVVRDLKGQPQAASEAVKPLVDLQVRAPRLLALSNQQTKP